MHRFAFVLRGSTYSYADNMCVWRRIWRPPCSVCQADAAKRPGADHFVAINLRALAATVEERNASIALELNCLSRRLAPECFPVKQTLLHRRV